MKKKNNLAYNPSIVSSTETQSGAQPTSWEDVAAMANKYPKQNEIVDPAKFEKPSEDFDTIATAVIRYTHCDLDKKSSFYEAIMTSNTKRWYPRLKAYQSPAKGKFENAQFEEWKQNIIDLDARTAIEKYGRGNTYNALKKLHNYLKSGNNAPTQTELLKNCFDKDDIGFDAAFDHLRYNRHSNPDWDYYSSRDERLGMEERINADGRLYLNAEPRDTFSIADKFVNACKETGLPYEFKINRNPDRADAMVFYIDNKEIGNYTEIISRILDENSQIRERVGKPPLLAEKVTDKIGYGDEAGGASYNERQCEWFQKVIESAALSYRGQAPNGSVQERVKFLYKFQHEKFLRTIKDRL